MVYQEQALGYVAYKFQSALGSPESGSGGKILRTTGGQGGRLSKGAVESAEVRQDAMSTRGRHGTQKTAGGYSHELSIGSFDDIMEAVMRGTFSAADLTITQSAMTSVTTGANTIVAAAGNWITEGLRVGEIIRATGLPDAANNGKNLRIVGLTASTITTAETLVVNAVADTAFSIVRPGRTLINPAAGALVKRYCTIEEYEINIDGSEIFDDCMWGSMKFAMQPNGMFTFDSTWVGPGKFRTLEGVSAPLLTTPSMTTSLPMAAIDATVRKGSTDLLDLTAFDLTIDIAPNSPDVVASKFGPDVFPGSVMVSMNLTALRKDLLDVADFLNETQLSLSVMIQEPEAAPQDFIAINIPNFTLGSVDKSALSKAGGPRTQSIAVPAALVGKDDRGGAYSPTMVQFQVSNPT